MQKPASFIVALFLFLLAAGQTSIKRPKIVVGIVVDQMRWDYLYRYYDRYAANGGFKRLLNQGYSCENTLIPYTPTITACGHAGIFTGSVPAIHGIVGNGWWDSRTNTSVYCTQDDNVKTVGSTTTAGQMSPANMLTTSICDELRLATNFKSKVIGVALKDRGSILPAGHSANAAYWYDSKTGDWISSTYYMTDLPQWVKDLNAKKLVDKYYEEGWSTFYPIETYEQSTEDNKTYENRPFGAGTNFPYNLKKFAGTNSYGYLPVTPYGNTFTFEMARAALTAEQLGKDSVTDFLTVSLSTPDYIGHTFGPNSVEAEDGFLRLDKELGAFLDFLNNSVGEGQYLVFLSADHGAAHVPQFLKEHHIPAGNVDIDGLYTNLNKSLKDKFRADDLVTEISNYQIYLNQKLISSSKLNRKEITQWVIDFALQYNGITAAFECSALATTTLNSRIKEMLTNGYNAARSGDIQLILEPQWIEGFDKGGTTHGLWNPYDAHIPLLWYGWNIKPGKLNRQTYMSDIAPTIAALLHIQMPSGNVGSVIEEITK
jgi:predicted AlkP superfamily pyrophosphatase or phosphodiesterase